MADPASTEPIDVLAALRAAVTDLAEEVEPGAGAVLELVHVGGFARAVVACSDRPSGVAQTYLGFDERSWRQLGGGGMIDPVELGIPAHVVDDLEHQALVAVEDGQ